MPREKQFEISPGLQHWRNQIPSTYYCTHSLAPLMYITDTMPIRVNALSIADPEQEKLSIRVGDPASVILCRMDNGAVFRLYGMRLPGYGAFRLTGSRGMMEAGYGANGSVRIILNEWELREGESADMTYKPKFKSHHDIAKKAGHGGGDFWTTHLFAEAVRTGEQPYLNVYRGVAMSVVGILGWKSALQEGAPFAVPDFSKEAERRLHEHDDWSPWPEDRRPGQPWPSIRGQLTPSDEAVAYAKDIWSKKGRSF
ncbi:MAG: oxidoreductase, partial [Paenibacillus sp.]|nr:oxidoreductase [Paenibacillus sp.]